MVVVVMGLPGVTGKLDVSFVRIMMMMLKGMLSCSGRNVSCGYCSDVHVVLLVAFVLLHANH